MVPRVKPRLITVGRGRATQFQAEPKSEKVGKKIEDHVKVVTEEQKLKEETQQQPRMTSQSPESPMIKILQSLITMAKDAKETARSALAAAKMALDLERSKRRDLEGSDISPLLSSLKTYPNGVEEASDSRGPLKLRSHIQESSKSSYVRRVWLVGEELKIDFQTATFEKENSLYRKQKKKKKKKKEKQEVKFVGEGTEGTEEKEISRPVSVADSQDEDVVSLSSSPGCSKRTEEQYVTHYDKSYLGREIKYCGGVNGFGKNWSEERKERVAVIVGFENGYLHLKWRGEEAVKKFIHVNQRSSGPEYQFRFTCSDEQTSQPENKKSQLKVECQFCRMTPCSHGKKIDSDQLKESLIGCSVKYCGTVWSGDREKLVGVVGGWRMDINEKNETIHIRWPGKTKQKVYPILSRTPENKVEISFQYYCRASYKTL